MTNSNEHKIISRTEISKTANGKPLYLTVYATGLAEGLDKQSVASALWAMRKDKIINDEKKLVKPKIAKEISWKPKKFSDKIIICLVDENPRREGTHGYQSMQICIEQKEIAFDEYVRLGGRTNDAKWDMNRGHIKMVNAF